jgi:hypothetical protein
MPDRQQHLDAYSANLALSLTLERLGYHDWAVTTMFYSALHLVDAILAIDGIHPRSHMRRDGYFPRYARLRPIWIEYHDLEERSKDARYNCILFSPADTQYLRRTRFEPLTQHLRAVLGI